MSNLVSLTCLSLKKLGSDFRDLGQSLINENSHNSKISIDTDKKLESLTKLDEGNTTTSKKFYNVVMLGSWDAIVIFLIYGQFGTVCKPDLHFH